MLWKMRPKVSKDAESKWINVLAEAFDDAGSEALKEAAIEVFSRLLPAFFAGTTGAAAATVVKSLFTNLDERSREVVKNTETILDEPFQTAAQTLRLVSSASLNSQSVIDEAHRLLRTAYDNFSKAYTYACSHDPSRCELIQVYQALTASMYEGGEEFAKNIVGELRERVEVKHLEATKLVSTAKSNLQNAEKMICALSSHREVRTALDTGMMSFEPRDYYCQLGLRAEKSLTEASTIVASCDNILKACKLIEQVVAVPRAEYRP